MTANLISLPFVPETEPDVRHARPDYDRMTDVSTFPCGLPGDAQVLVAWAAQPVTCPGCLAAREAQRQRVAESTVRNAEWLERQTNDVAFLKERLEVVTAERDSLRALANAAMTLRETADAELAECRKLAEQALHGPHELRLGVANVLVARLVRGGGQ